MAKKKALMKIKIPKLKLPAVKAMKMPKVKTWMPKLKKK